MSFIFTITSATHLPSAGIYALDGTLQSGTIVAGSEGVIRDTAQRIKVKSVALVNAMDVGSGRLTLSVEKPSFPIGDLKAGMVLEG